MGFRSSRVHGHEAPEIAVDGIAMDAYVERSDGRLLQQSEDALMRIEADETSFSVIGDDLEGSQSIALALLLEAKGFGAVWLDQ
jgi:hypothetical protein